MCDTGQNTILTSGYVNFTLVSNCLISSLTTQHTISYTLVIIPSANNLEKYIFSYYVHWNHEFKSIFSQLKEANFRPMQFSKLWTSGFFSRAKNISFLYVKLLSRSILALPELLFIVKLKIIICHSKQSSWQLNVYTPYYFKLPRVDWL